MRGGGGGHSSRVLRSAGVEEEILPRVELSQNSAPLSLSPSGGERVYCQLAFVVASKDLRQSALKGTDLRRRLQLKHLQRKDRRREGGQTDTNIKDGR